MAKIKKNPRATIKKVQVFAKISRDSRPKLSIPKEAQQIMLQDTYLGRKTGRKNVLGKGKQVGTKKRGKGIATGFYY